MHFPTVSKCSVSFGQDASNGKSTHSPNILGIQDEAHQVSGKWHPQRKYPFQSHKVIDHTDNPMKSFPSSSGQWSIVAPSLFLPIQTMFCEAITSALYLTQLLPLQSCSQNGGAGCDRQKDLFFLSWRVGAPALGEDGSLYPFHFLQDWYFAGLQDSR